MISSQPLRTMNIKFIYTLIFCVGIAIPSQAQWQISSYGFQTGPGLAFKFQKANNNNIVPGFKYTYQQMSDSTKKIDQYRVGYDLGANVMFDNGGKLFIQLGLQYRSIGFRRVIENLKYHDSIQYFGKIDVYSQTGSKDARYKYMYHMVELPVHFLFGMQKIEKMFDPFTWFLSVGVTPTVVFKNTMWARLYGFDIDGVNQIRGQQDVNFSYKKFMLYPTIGAKFMYRHPENDNIKFSIQPTIYLPTGSITAPGSGINMWIPSISLHAGVNFKID